MILWNFTTPLTLLACALWNFCESARIPLGKLAPYLFGLAIGSRPKKKPESEDPGDSF